MATRRHKDKSKETSENKRMKMSEVSIKVNRKMIKKLLRYDSQIISKIDTLINDQKDIKNCLKDVKKKLGENNNKTNNAIDYDYIKNLVKKVTKNLFEKSIYPSQDEYRDATEKFLKYENLEFLSKFRKNEWTLFYERNIIQNMQIAICQFSKCDMENTRVEKQTQAISICETFLNPGNQDIHMNEKLLKPKIIKNLQKLENKEKFLCFEAEDESSSTDADNSKLGKSANNNKGTNNTDGKNADNGEGVNADRNDEGANTDSKGGKWASIKNNKGEGIYDSDGSYNTEEEDRYLSSLFDNSSFFL
ncbi:hypothetical protein GLOIN_2v1482020 [Rhizophagus clarus]|uniref:Uncharacterized protein n=1 Tax=Rhizophagus clarus TaxID=94130 RepID=A0A8H3M7E3_9GLOM|nr:hypothetical protein GLOIN_2v1482020 [Rhizophagus clarus]